MGPCFFCPEIAFPRYFTFYRRGTEAIYGVSGVVKKGSLLFTFEAPMSAETLHRLEGATR